MTTPPTRERPGLPSPSPPLSSGILLLLSLMFIFVCLELPARLPFPDAQGRATRGCRPCRRPGRDERNVVARQAGGQSGSPSVGQGQRAGARLPGAEAEGSQLLNPLLVAVVGPRGAVGADAEDSGNRGR